MKPCSFCKGKGFEEGDGSALGRTFMEAYSLSKEHSSAQLAAVTAQRDGLLTAARDAQRRIKAQEKLLVCYRLGGKAPPEWVFADLEKTKDLPEHIDAAIAACEAKEGEPNAK